MEFPREVMFAHENVTYKATLVKNEDNAAAASVTSTLKCIICDHALGAKAFYRTDPVILQVHAECVILYAQSNFINSDSLLTSSRCSNTARPEHRQGLGNHNYPHARRPNPYPPPPQQHPQGLVNPMNHNYLHAYGPYPYAPPQQPQHPQGLVNPMNHNYPHAYRPYHYSPHHEQHQQQQQHHYYPTNPSPYPPPQQQQQYPQDFGNPIGHCYPPYPSPPPQQSQHSQGQVIPINHNYSQAYGPYPYYPPYQQQQQQQPPQGIWNSVMHGAMAAFSGQLLQEVFQNLSS